MTPTERAANAYCNKTVLRNAYGDEIEAMQAALTAVHYDRLLVHARNVAYGNWDVSWLKVLVDEIDSEMKN